MACFRAQQLIIATVSLDEMKMLSAADCHRNKADKDCNQYF